MEQLFANVKKKYIPISKVCWICIYILFITLHCNGCIILIGGKSYSKDCFQFWRVLDIGLNLKSTFARPDLSFISDISLQDESSAKDISQFRVLSSFWSPWQALLLVWRAWSRSSLAFWSQRLRLQLQFNVKCPRTRTIYPLKGNCQHMTLNTKGWNVGLAWSFYDVFFCFCFYSTFRSSPIHQDHWP